MIGYETGMKILQDDNEELYKFMSKNKGNEQIVNRYSKLVEANAEKRRHQDNGFYAYYLQKNESDYINAASDLKEGRSVDNVAPAVALPAAPAPPVGGSGVDSPQLESLARGNVLYFILPNKKRRVEGGKKTRRNKKSRKERRKKKMSKKRVNHCLHR